MKSGAVDVVPLADKVIPGLTLHLPLSEKELRASLCGSLFTLFESCVRSKLKLELRSLFDQQKSQWVVNLLIENQLISKGFSESNWKLRNQSYASPLHCISLSKAKTLAANRALDCLKNCPQKQNTQHESFIRIGETIPGLKLYLNGPSRAGEDCLALLTQSCHKCNLPLTWWDDDGCNVFKSSCITVLLINSKPICFAWGDNLEKSKKETAAKAISLLKIRHKVVSKENDPVSKVASEEKDPVSKVVSKEKDPVSKVVNKVKDPVSKVVSKEKDPVSKVARKEKDPVSKVASKEKDPVSKVASKERDPLSKVTCKEKDPLSKVVSKEKDPVWTSFWLTGTQVPGLTLYLPTDGRDQGEDEIVQLSVNLSQLTWKFTDLGLVNKNAKIGVYATNLVIGDTIVAWGYGRDAESSRKNIKWKSVLESLLETQASVVGQIQDPKPSIQPIVCYKDSNKDSRSLSITEPLGCEPDECLKSSHDNQPIASGANEEPNFQVTNNVVPGLTMYVRDAREDVKSRIDARAAIDRSAGHSHLNQKLKDMGQVMRNGKLMYAAALTFDSTIVAWAYGDSRESSRKNMYLEGVLDSLLKTQPVVKWDDSASHKSRSNIQRKRTLLASSNTSNNIKVASSIDGVGKGSECDNKIARITGEDGSIEMVDKGSEHDINKVAYITGDNGSINESDKGDEHDNNKKETCVTGGNGSIDKVDKGSQLDKLYIVLSEWLDENDSSVERMFDSDEIIRKYMELV